MNNGDYIKDMGLWFKCVIMVYLLIDIVKVVFIFLVVFFNNIKNVSVKFWFKFVLIWSYIIWDGFVLNNLNWWVIGMFVYFVV